MISRTIPYVDYNGVNRKETFYFDLTQFEATEIAVELPDGILNDIDIDNEEDKLNSALTLTERLGKKGVMDFIKKIVLKSYGVKSPDGRRFIKSEELATEFSQTPAFNSFMMELLTDDVAAANFISGVIPSDLVKNMKEGTAPVAK